MRKTPPRLCHFIAARGGFNFTTMHDNQPLRRVTVRGVIVDGVARLQAEVPVAVARRWQDEATRQGLGLKDALVQHLFDKDRTSPAATIEETARALAEGAEAALRRAP